MRVADMTWMQVETYLEQDDRCVIPLGCTEQHRTCPSPPTRRLRSASQWRPPIRSASRSSRLWRMASRPCSWHTGTVSLSPSTYERLLVEMLGSVQRHGFKRIVLVNGHGGNAPARPAVEAWTGRREGVTVRWHDWWRAPRTRAAVHRIDPDASHASWMESFPWTRVAGVLPPADAKHRIDLAGVAELSPERYRERLGDGSFGGAYERSDADMLAIWDVAIEETREVLSGGW